MVSLFTEQFFKNTHEKQNCFSNPAAGQQKLVNPTNQNQFYLLYQTLICVAAAKLHSQPHYPIAS
jgi:hypothetical protein